MPGPYIDTRNHVTQLIENVSNGPTGELKIRQRLPGERNFGVGNLSLQLGRNLKL
jgi:hypothetical protein